jgi:hypothetical protein
MSLVRQNAADGYESGKNSEQDLCVDDFQHCASGHGK